MADQSRPTLRDLLAAIQPSVRPAESFPIRLRPVRLKPAGVVDAMSTIMLVRAGGAGSCTRDDLLYAGFTAAEVDAFGARASQLARRRAVRRVSAPA